MTSYVEDNHRPYLSFLIVGLATVLLLFLVALTANALKENSYIGQRPDVQNTFTVSGEGEVVAVPDTARFRVTVSEEAETVEEAQQSATEDANAIISYLEDNDVSRENIKTLSYNVSPRYEFREASDLPRPLPPEGERVLVGYEVSQTLEVKVEDTDQAGELLSGVGSREADNVSGLEFVTDDDEELQMEARRRAIADAREKAQVLANDLGVDIVSVVNFSESGTPTPMHYERLQANDAAEEGTSGSAPDLPAGENQIIARVSVTYEIR